ncbi:MAG: hypothetical protein EOO39_23360 [Cytophagaceae bacterium]|nr:MAG: hypothetical protein EOO39_23360 [Cytophagaceae bacterium]
MVTSNRILLVELIQDAFTSHVLDQFGTTMSEAYLLDNWTTDEGFLVNGITPDGLIYEVEEQGRTLYGWDILYDSTLQEVLTHLKEESFA